MLPLSVGFSLLLVLASLLFVFYSNTLHKADFGGVASYEKISATSGGMSGVIDSDEAFGTSIDNIGDLNGDGIEDLAVGANTDDVGGNGTGAAYILFMKPNGTVGSNVRIGQGSGGFGGTINSTNFGSSVANIGDLDDDGVTDIAVGAYTDNDGGSQRGAVWILFMNDDGTVRDEQKISDTAGGFGGTLANSDFFGRSVAGIGDLDDDGIEDIIVGASGHDEDGSGTGAAWVLFLDTDGTVQSEQKINESNGGFGGEISGSIFGISADSVGDLDLDGNNDVVIGAAFDGDGGSNAGAAWILFLDDDGTVISEQKLSSSNGVSGITASTGFGSGVSVARDLDGNGVQDVFIGGFFVNKVWAVFLDRGGNAIGQEIIGENLAGFGGSVSGSGFGISVSEMGPSEAPKLAVGAWTDSDGGSNYGAIWTMQLRKTYAGNDGYVAPKNLGFSINGGVACVTSRDVVLDLHAENAEDVIVGSSPTFVGSEWQPYIQPSPMDLAYELPDEDGMHQIYVLYRSISRNLSLGVMQEVQLDRVNNCGAVIEPVCEQNCEDLAYEFFLITPLGDEYSTSGDHVQIYRSGATERYYFEDKDDFDFNDIVMEALIDRCGVWTMRLLQVNAGWHHQIGVRVFYQGDVIAEEIIAEDSHEAIGRLFSFDSANYYPVCPVIE